MMWEVLFLLLPVAAGCGWLFGHRSAGQRSRESSRGLPKDYLTGLNYLINEKPDKAVDVFIRMLEVDSQTVETHLALGSLFRRRGEISRATRLHQNLIARPQLDDRQRKEALAELAQDYLSAGVLDRAEQLFLQLVNDQEQAKPSLYALIDIYQQQRDWNKAIEIADKIAQLGDHSILPVIAHYYCILAEKVRKNAQPEIARKYLKRALSADKHSVRAHLLLAQLDLDLKHTKNAIKLLEKAIEEDPDYISEILPCLCQAYEQQYDKAGLIDQLKAYFQRYPRASVLMMLSDYVAEQKGHQAAMAYLSSVVKDYPSLKGLNQLIDLYIVYSEDETREKLTILRNLTDQLISVKPNYRCQQCGFSGQSLYWLCPSCKQWNTVKPIQGIEGD